MGQTFIHQYFNNLGPAFLKSAFSFLAVMVQNVSKYAENNI
tara:strand:- start:66600 stop:66722 length:123 start_codon:yes stop_codon:yes gene_type:complete